MALPINKAPPNLEIALYMQGGEEVHMNKESYHLNWLRDWTVRIRETFSYMDINIYL